MFLYRHDVPRIDTDLESFAHTIPKNSQDIFLMLNCFMIVLYGVPVNVKLKY